VAVKRLHHHLAADPELVARFLDEARVEHVSSTLMSRRPWISSTTTASSTS
jgi:hypothetical protein